MSALDITPGLLSELQKADQIIIAMLNAMTVAQKSKVHAQLDADGVSDDGMTRHHERRAVIDAAEAALAQPSAIQVQSSSLGTTSASNDDFDAMSLALAAMNATDLGVSIIKELETFFRTIEALASPVGESQKSMRDQLTTIQRLARLAVHFTFERGDTFSFHRDQAHETLAALKGGAV